MAPRKVLKVTGNTTVFITHKANTFSYKKQPVDYQTFYQERLKYTHKHS